MTLVLASRSPQRRSILARLGVDFEVRPPDVNEKREGEPLEVVVSNALLKARAVSRESDELVLGADTEVVLDRRIYGKAVDEGQARAYLEQLSGRVHEVVGGIALKDQSERTATEVTSVRFRHLDDGLIDWYLSTGEWRDRAGAYAVQGRGAALIDGIEGDFFNVVGLPVKRLLDLVPELLEAHGGS